MLLPNQTAVSPRPRRGAVAVLVAICLVALLSIVAIALDGGVLMDQRRRAQATADAAALAAAIDLYQNYPTNGGVDISGTARQSALTTAAAMGYANDGNPSTVTVNVPPQSGTFAGQVGYAEVLVQWNQSRSFSNIFGSGSIPVTARAVAAGRWVPFSDGIIVLHPTAASAFNANGNGDINVMNACVVVDSNSSEAATTKGRAYLAVPNKPILITGSLPGCDGTFVGTTLTGQQPTPDPLAYLPPPDPTTMPIASVKASGSTITLEPGRYPGGLFFGGQTSVNMAPGIYYMDGGGFCFSGKGNLNAQGVMIYSTGGLSITGQGSVTLSPPTSGIYQGISYFQDRNCTAMARIAGNRDMHITGTLYVPAGITHLQGSGDASIASQVISLLMRSGGDGVTNIDWAGPSSARMRAIQLVE
jgi:Flp pilus assembly protein TadG